MDWGKFAYEQQQKADAADKLQRQQQKLSTPKEMQFSARIAGEGMAGQQHMG
jgi:translation initiation factor IF-3